VMLAIQAEQAEAEVAAARATAADVDPTGGGTDDPGSPPAD
jgi:hypothetical protein